MAPRAKLACLRAGEIRANPSSVATMTTGKVTYGYLANEVYFAAEGTFDFATQSWGPQDLRIVMGRPAGVGMATAKDTGVKELSDLRGKRIGMTLRECVDFIDMYDPAHNNTGQLHSLIDNVKARRETLLQQRRDIDDMLAGLDEVQELCEASLAASEPGPDHFNS